MSISPIEQWLWPQIPSVKKTIKRATGEKIKIMLLDAPLRPTPWLRQNDKLTILRAGDTSSSNTLHATANLSLLLGDGENWPGLTPSAEVYFYQSLQSNNRQDTLRHTAQALCVALRLNIDIVAMPFGSRAAHQPLSHALEKAQQAGLWVFAAAGNRGPDSHFFPARHPAVFSVSATDSHGTPLPHVAQSAKVNQYFPGKDVPCRLAGKTRNYTGSSQACVIAAALAARIRQCCGDNAKALKQLSQLSVTPP